MSSTRFTQQHIIELNEKPASSLLMNKELQNIYKGTNELDDEAKIHRAKQADPTLADTATEKHVTNAQTKKWEDTANTFSGVSPSSFVAAAEKDQPGGYAGLDNNGALKSKIMSTHISDFNTATIGGLYFAGSDTLNGPPPILGSYAITALVIDRIGYTSITQIAFGAFTEVYIRCSTNTSNTEWTDWRRLDEVTWGSISGTLADQTDLQTALAGKANTSDVYTMGNVLGTVSQLEGVPTGAIIESGSNINGEYTKFADGTLICKQFVSIAGSWETGVSLVRTWTFPAEMIAITFVPLYQKAASANSVDHVLSSRSTTGISFTVTNNTGGDIGAGISEMYLAIGRWY